MSKILKIIIPIIVGMFFISCAKPNLNLDSMLQKKSLNKQPVVSENIFGMPRDAYKVVLAIGSKILNKKGNYKDVILQSPYQTNFKEAALFTFSNAVLINYQDDMSSNSKSLKADIYFSDYLNRQTAYTINANYHMDGNKIVVNNYSVSDKFTESNKAVCFIIPADKYKMIFFQKKYALKNFYALYKYAAINAVNPSKSKAYTDKNKWAILVFFMNKMSKSASAQLGICDKTNKYDMGYTKDSKYINFDGWRVATAVGEFKLLTYANKASLYAKAFFTPGKEYAGNFLTKTPELIGLYKIK